MNAPKDVIASVKCITHGAHTSVWMGATADDTLVIWTGVKDGQQYTWRIRRPSVIHELRSTTGWAAYDIVNNIEDIAHLWDGRVILMRDGHPWRTCTPDVYTGDNYMVIKLMMEAEDFSRHEWGSLYYTAYPV